MNPERTRPSPEHVFFKCHKCGTVSRDDACGAVFDMRAYDDQRFYDGICPSCGYSFWMKKYIEGQNDIIIDV